MNINDIPLTLLFIILALLFLLSAFFSGSETALMALNRYKLSHLSEKNHGAKLALKLLQQPDRLIGLILLGNNLVNILITQLATLIGFRLGGSAGVAIATGVLTFLLLIFAEVTPKTIAALRAEKVAFPAAYIYTPMLKFAYPFVWLINLIANTIVKLVGVNPKETELASLSHEELKSVVNEASGMIPENHQEMLIRVLDIESITTEDIMVPRTEIQGINIQDDWNDIEESILKSNFTRILVFDEHIDQTIGFIHLRSIIPLIHEDKMDKKNFETAITPALYTQESISLTQQLLNFKKALKRIALVVDEYGEIQGLITLEDILEEIVGEFSTSPANFSYEIHTQKDGTIWVDGAINIRDLNRQIEIKLPTTGAKTINGLIIEYLQDIPAPGTTVLINNYPMEVRKIRNNAIKTLIIYPKLETSDSDK